MVTSERKKKKREKKSSEDKAGSFHMYEVKTEFVGAWVLYLLAMQGKTLNCFWYPGMLSGTMS